MQEASPVSAEASPPTARYSGSLHASALSTSRGARRPTHDVALMPYIRRELDGATQRLMRQR